MQFFYGKIKVGRKYFGNIIHRWLLGILFNFGPNWDRNTYKNVKILQNRIFVLKRESSHRILRKNPIRVHGQNPSF